MWLLNAAGGDTHMLRLIYLRSGEVLLSKKQYTGWQEIAGEYEQYMTDMCFETVDDMVSFFELDFGVGSEWPFSKREILDFIVSDKLVVSTEN